jgi:holo-[acyl-carrier protein] synthase
MLMALLAMLIAAVSAATVVLRRARARRGVALRVGIDIVEIACVEETLASPSARRYLDVVYTEAEQRDSLRSGAVDPSRLAARFAAKEAVFKALGERSAELPWRAVEVVRGVGGEPSVRLHGRAVAAARALGLSRFAVSLTHEPGYAAAMVVAQ